MKQNLTEDSLWNKFITSFSGNEFGGGKSGGGGATSTWDNAKPVVKKTTPKNTVTPLNVLPIIPKKKTSFPCKNFPLKFGCKGDLVKQVQTIIMMPTKYQTGYFGPITLKKLRDFSKTNTEVGLNPSDFNDPAAITKSTYDKLMNFVSGMNKPLVAPTPQVSVNPTPKIDTTVLPKITPTAPLPKKTWSPLDIFKSKEKTVIAENIEEIKGMFKRIL